MSDSPSSYAVEPASLETDRDVIIALWASNLGQPERRRDKFDWFYLRNPGGRPTVVLARSPVGSLHSVGVLGLGPRQMQIDGERINAGLMADFGVSAEHRTLYPAMLLQTTLRDLCLPGLGLMFGFPNPKSEPVVRRLGYSVVGRLVRYVRVLRSADYLPVAIPQVVRQGLGASADWWRHTLRLQLCRRKLKGLLVQWQEQPDSRFDDLWQTQIGQPMLIGVRDRAFLAWRFEQKPWRQSRFLTLQRPDGSLVAYAVCEIAGKVLHIRDVLTDPSLPNSLELILWAVFRHARKNGQSSVSFEFLGPESMRKTLLDQGMVPREYSNVLATTLSSSKERALLTRDWYVTFADQDI